ADTAVRLAAVGEISRALDTESLALLRARSAVEPNAGVKEAIDIGLALAALDGGDTRARLDAITLLTHTLRPDVRNRLAALVEPTADGGVADPDVQVRQAAERAVRAIDRARALYGGIETLFFGLSVGSVLVLVA